MLWWQDRKKKGSVASWHGIKKKKKIINPEIICNYQELALGLVVSRESNNFMWAIKLHVFPPRAKISRPRCHHRNSLIYECEIHHRCGCELWWSHLHWNLLTLPLKSLSSLLKNSKFVWQKPDPAGRDSKVWNQGKNLSSPSVLPWW